MIDRKVLLSDLQGLLKSIEADLIARSDLDDLPEVRDWLKTEYSKAKEAERTAHNYEDWLIDYVTQVAAAWVLSCVFVRFLEDNGLIDPPRVSGPGDRLKRARDERVLFFREHPTETDREYLLFVFGELARLPGGKDLFGPHNILNELPNWISGDAAGELLSFFQKIKPDTGELVHDFTDDDWNTRFLGDLYQDLSEKARKKYALLQTPDFVEEFILDRTLEPALDEFGLTPDTNSKSLFKMIDPACGSGHFLLGAFPRILSRWQKQEPGTNIRELVQRTLDSIHGVDINPFAIAIARFRLLLAALRACDVKRLVDAPAFAMNLACGDSLYHGKSRQQTMGFADEAHYFSTENSVELNQILEEESFHAIVANPPYITVKDKAPNKAYREIYQTCHRKYSLAIPFMERLFELGIDLPERGGFVGQITANSFMKREFGKKVIEEFFPKTDLTHIIDTSGAYLPGHGTPTVILFGRSRLPKSDVIRTAMGILGEPSTPEVPSQGLVWVALLNQIDNPNSESDFYTIVDLPRNRFSNHPWSLTGGGAVEVKDTLDRASSESLKNMVSDFGCQSVPGEDEAFVAPHANLRRRGLRQEQVRDFVEGDEVRQWMISGFDACVFPYDDRGKPRIQSEQFRYLWTHKSVLKSTIFFSKNKYQRGMYWWEFALLVPNRMYPKASVAFGEVSSHNHFVFDDTGKIFKNSIHLLKFPSNEKAEKIFALTNLLNCSAVCFWMKQVCFPKGGDHVGSEGARVRRNLWDERYAFNATPLQDLPIPSGYGQLLRWDLQSIANLNKQQVFNSPECKGIPGGISDVVAVCEANKRKLIRMQEDLDWECYRLYGLLDDDVTYPSEQSLGIQLGERAFEIVMARKMAAGELTTTWFERHGSTPLTELPDHWPDDYKQLVQRRIDVIESNPQIALIEQPEYKRRWNTTPWEEQVEKALKSWLLDRLESYFDFDGRMNDEGKATAQLDISLISVAKLADIARQDEQFMEVAEVYRDDPAFDVQKLVEELVKGEHVPMLPILRYKPAGLRKRSEWEKTWQLQRLEDEIQAGNPTSDPRVAELIKDCEITPKQVEQIEKWQQSTPEKERTDTTLPSARELDKILSIPVPPKYKSSDMISTGGAKYWKLRGKLDVPKERWISFPHCDSEDGSMMICWAGYDHLQQATAIAAWYVRIKEEIGGAEDPRLIPLLAALIEILPWLKQWHNEIDPTYPMAMGDFYEGFINEEARSLPKKTTTEDGEEVVTTGWTLEEIKDWQPPQKKKRTRKKSTKKKVTK